MEHTDCRYCEAGFKPTVGKQRVAHYRNRDGTQFFIEEETVIGWVVVGGVSENETLLQTLADHHNLVRKIAERQ